MHRMVTRESEPVRDMFMTLDVKGNRAFLLTITGNGFIRLTDFENLCRRFAPKLSSETLLRAFQVADSNGDGRVTFRDFERILSLAKKDTTGV